MGIATASVEAGRPVDRVARQVEEVSSLPMVAMRVMEVTNDANTGAAELKEVLESDASLRARVLRLVNSSAYGVQQRVGNLQTAIAYLGFRQIRNLALTASIADIFRSDETLGKYNRPNLWRHLISVGIGARMVAMRHRMENFEDVFLAGLLHDIGIILEDQYDHANFRRMMLALSSTTPLEESERKELGYAHTVLGKIIAERWRFPELAIAAIQHHHDGVAPAGEYQQAIRCVQVANSLCSYKGICSVGMNLVRPPVDAIHGLSLSKPDVEALLVDLDEELARNAMLFSM